MCMGVATANSILVISFSKEKLDEGKTPSEAALEAGYTRFRPVLMTALAMIIGMLPMSLGLGEGGEQNAPLGRAVIGGLSFATVATSFFVPDAVQANLLAATAAKPEAVNQVYNVALNKRTTLIELFSILKELLLQNGHDVGACEPLYREFQRGDVWHSQADITKISELLGFSPVYGVREGLAKTLPWYIETAGRMESGFATVGLSRPRKVTGVMK